MNEDLNVYTVYWLDGKREVLRGQDEADAFNCAGYGRGALRAIDFIAIGDDDRCEYDSTKKDWALKEEIDRC